MGRPFVGLGHLFLKLQVLIINASMSKIVKQTKTLGVVMIVISILFFIAAATGLFHLVYGKLPAMRSPAHHPEAYRLGFYLGKYVHFYLLPFFWAFVGWLLYKCGSEKIRSGHPEEKKSPKISE